MTRRGQWGVSVGIEGRQGSPWARTTFDEADGAEAPGTPVTVVVTTKWYRTPGVSPVTAQVVDLVTQVTEPGTAVTTYPLAPGYAVTLFQDTSTRAPATLATTFVGVAGSMTGVKLPVRGAEDPPGVCATTVAL
jgi:uncharacterized protein (DUF2141 family)